jgi:hypothetical protein
MNLNGIDQNPRNESATKKTRMYLDRPSFDDNVDFEEAMPQREIGDPDHVNEGWKTAEELREMCDFTQVCRRRSHT